MPLYRPLAIVFVTLLFFVLSPRADAQEESSAVPAAGERQPVALVGGTLIHPERAPQPDATILIDGGTIQAVGSSEQVDIPPGTRTVDVRGKYVVPGLIDGHVHFFQSGGLYTRPDVLNLQAVRSHAEEMQHIRDRLPDTFRRYLRSGITSVVDAGGPMWNLDVRTQADTTARAPTVVTAGPLISSVSRPSLSEGDPPIKKITTPQAAREEVQQQVEAGVDLIKIWYIVPSGESPAAYRPVVDAAIEAADDAGRRVAVHATQLETARAAVEAGADVLVHSVFDAPVDEAFVQLLLDREVLYVPTLMVRERYRETFAGELDLTAVEHRIAQKDVVGSLFDFYALPDSVVPAGIRQRLTQDVGVPSDTVAMQNLRRLHEAGVAVAAGTDAGNIGTPHGPALHREMELMREAGLSPRDILQTATVGGARLMGRDDRGRIEAGRKADLIVVDDNPLDNVDHLFTAHRIVKTGRVYRPNDLLPRTPREVVGQWMNAVNARDVGGALDAMADSVVVEDVLGIASARGAEPVRDRVAGLFRSAPGLHVEAERWAVRDRTVQVDVAVTGHPDAPARERQRLRIRLDADGFIASIERR